MSSNSDSGTLPLVVLVPGGPGLVAPFYRELIEQVGEFGRVLTYEQRGSEPPDSKEFHRSVAAYAQELSEVVEREADSHRPTVLMGHSFGVAVVIEALLSGLPAQGAILLNGFDSAAMLARGLQARRRELPEPFQLAYDGMEEKRLETLMPILAEHFYPNHFCRLERWPDSFLEAMAKLNMELAVHFLGTDLFEPDGEIARWDRSKELYRITQPTLLVSGVYDYYLEEDLNRMTSALGNGEAWISRGGSHTPWVEDPYSFSAAVGRFLSLF
ncbi:MAG: alpha/beta fold hydrolase [Spirochaetaceae bacterium]